MEQEAEQPDEREGARGPETQSLPLDALVLVELQTHQEGEAYRKPTVPEEQHVHVDHRGLYSARSRFMTGSRLLELTQEQIQSSAVIGLFQFVSGHCEHRLQRLFGKLR